MQQPPRPSGFTLIEILVVVVVLGIVAAGVAGAFPQRGGRLDVVDAADQIAGALRLARAEAIAFGQPTSLVVDADGRGYQVGLEHHGLPRAVLATSALIRFNPAGGASGGTVRVAGRSKAMLVRVDWLTGRVVVMEGS